jgi:hypothetical protein
MNPLLIDEFTALFGGKRPVAVKTDLHKFKMVSVRLIQTRIGEEVVITGALLNQARHRQPFPVLDVSIVDKEGNILEHFKMTKKDYLQKTGLRKGHYIEPRERILFRFRRNVKDESPQVKLELE